MSSSETPFSDEPLLLYHEEQRFRQPWLWAILLGSAGMVWYTFISHIFFRRPLGSNPAPDSIVVLFWLLVGLGLPLVAYFSRLIIEVRTSGLYFRFIPFHRAFHRIAFSDIKTCRARRYRPLREYGGWGIRWSSQGKAYNVSGDQGVQLELGDGRRILFGSQRPAELFQAINAFL